MQGRQPRQVLNPFEHAQHLSAAPSGSWSKMPSSSCSGRTCTVLILMFAQPIFLLFCSVI